MNPDLAQAAQPLQLVSAQELRDAEAAQAGWFLLLAGGGGRAKHKNGREGVTPTLTETSAHDLQRCSAGLIAGFCAGEDCKSQESG